MAPSLHCVGVCAITLTSMCSLQQNLVQTSSKRLQSLRVLPSKRRPTCHTCFTYSFYFPHSFFWVLSKGEINWAGLHPTRRNTVWKKKPDLMHYPGQRIPASNLILLGQPQNTHSMFGLSSLLCCISSTKSTVIRNIVGQRGCIMYLVLITNPIWMCCRVLAGFFTVMVTWVIVEKVSHHKSLIWS